MYHKMGKTERVLIMIMYGNEKPYAGIHATAIPHCEILLTFWSK